MKHSSVNLKQLTRKSIPALGCLIFLLSSGGFVASLHSSKAGSSVRALAQVEAKEEALGLGESGCTDADFTAAATSPEGAGTNPHSVAVGDFNNDGRPDLAAANLGSDNVTILLGDGTGNFTQPATSPEGVGTGVVPRSVAVGDFNNDGRLDLATANQNSDQVAILLGDGTGNFTQPATSPEGTGSAPQSVAVGDFNLDGRPDLAVANAVSDNVTILLGDGTGNFTAAATSPEAAGDGSISVAVGDFNLDGRPDLAAANLFSDNVTILLGDGTGNFTAAATSPEGAGDGSRSVAVGDFNNDGRPDLATANLASDNVTILLGDGTGNFTQPATSPEGAGDLTYSVAVGDFNNDGRPDLAAANQNSDNVTILLGDGTGNFAQPTTSAEGAGDIPSSVAVGDFNNDGRPDLAAASLNSNTVTILLNTCTLRTCPTNFTAAATSPEAAGDAPSSVAVGDFNLDGRPDLATANSNSDNVSILLGDGTGNFTPAATSPEAVGDVPFSVAVGDFNLDGRPDLATANISDNVSILLGDGTGNFTPAATSPEAAGDGPRSVAVGDFNLDGRPDLATANSNSNSVSILLGDGTGNFNQPNTSPEAAGFFPRTVAVGDFNLDGRPDLATANVKSNNVSILLGDGTGNFTPAATSPEGAGDITQSVAVGDFNNDGRPDLAAANSNSNSVSILLGDGTGNFTPAATSPEAVGDIPFSVAVGDFNLDGRPDLATANFSDNVSILLGDGTGNFTPAATSPEAAGINPFSVAVGDFNLDGRPDLATANNGSNNVSILLGTCNTPPMITAQAVSQAADTSSTLPIATVTDPDQSLQTLSVTISSDGMNFSSSATLNGVTVSSLAVDSMGQVTATVSATCSATSATFTLKVTDDAGATDTDLLTVTVTPETVPPMIICPANITRSNDSNQCGAVVTYQNATATDNCTGVGTPSCSPSSGSFFPLGTTTVNCTVSDGAGHQSSCSFTVTVTDTQAPAITCPANITRGNDTNQCGAVVKYPNATVTDNCTGFGMPSCSPSSGSFFPKGTTTVNCTVSDASNNQSSCSFTVTVNDTQPPVIACPANITRGNDPNQCGAVVTYPNATAIDNCPGVGTPSCSPSSGSFFAKGTTTVNCMVSDAAGNQSSCSFTVTVNDTQPPSITCPANITATTANAGDPCVVVIFTTPTGSDNCPGVTVVCNPPSGSCLPRGTTTVTCTATDTSANATSCSFIVTVFDLCLQDGSNPGTVLLINTATGDYRFCCNGITFTGRGKMTIQGSTYRLEHNPLDRRVLATIDESVHRGTATLQAPPGTMRCTITDTNTQNNNCACQ